MRGEIKYIENKVANDFLLPKHYSGRKPQITVAFGWYVDNILSAVCTFGKPASNTLCDGICGKEYSKDVYELNRLCRVDDFNGSCMGSVGLRSTALSNYKQLKYENK
jgi:hypothetical protein